jgi:alanyl-tRNA synthetase
LGEQFKTVFPELHQQADFVTRVVREEEESFHRTLEKGLRKFDEIAAQAAASSIVDGAAAFELYDTFGFPIDLTRLIAQEKGYQVDEKAFEQEMTRQKERSRAATALDTDDWVVLSEPAEDRKENPFIGYTELESEAKLLRYRKIKAKGKESFQLVLDRTPFYAESGGQVGDTGWLRIGDERVNVIDTRKENDLILHIVPVIPEKMEGGVQAWVDAPRRKATAVHHTATHLLHAALRQVLGTHVAQKGSLVNAEHLRFDFSHFAKMTPEEIRQVESIVNAKIRENIPVVIREMPKEEAIAMGAMALFGEKYADVVRVVVIDPRYSIELCGGTHVGSTGELGYFTITAETAVAAGVRRIEAMSGEAAAGLVRVQMDLLDSLGQMLRNPKDPAKAVESLQQENAELKKHIEHLEGRMLVGIRNELLKQDEIINGITFIGAGVNVSNADALKKLLFDLKNHLNDYLVVLTANIGGKPFVAVGIDDKVVAARGLDAGKIIKETVAPLIKGGGGGQKNLATAGGQDASNLDAVTTAVKKLLS